MEIVRLHLPPRAPRARLGILMTALIVLVAGYGASRTSAFQWALLRASLHSQFPQVQWITTRELADWLEDRHRPPPPLLDVRTVEEWNVSHLPMARRVDPGLPRKWLCPAWQEMFRSLPIARSVTAPPNLPRAWARPPSHMCKIWRAPFSGGRMSIAHS